MRALLLTALLLGCGGATLEVTGASHAPEKVEKSETTAKVEHPGEKADPARAERVAHAAVACFLHGTWEELANGKDRCAFLASDVLHDAKSLPAVRAIEPSAVDAVVDAITRAGPADAQLGAVVRSVADAAREAMRARAEAERARKPSGQGDEAILSASAALAHLNALESKLGRVVALVLAADHLENVKGLAPRFKIAAAAPAFTVIFGAPRPTTTAPGAWLAYVSSAAAAAGHGVPDQGNTHERAQAAFAGVVQGLAERMESAANAATGEARSVAIAYAKRLRDALAETAAKAKAKADAKTTADEAEKKSGKP